MKILVTGSTGFIGSHIVEELSKQGLAIRAAFRPGEDFKALDSDFLIDGLDLDSFPLDTTDRNAVFNALKGCQILFHSDSLCSFEGRDKTRLYQINHIGTKNLMEAALHHGVEKIIYTSGVETLRAPKGQALATERDGVSMEDLKTHFGRSRLMAEREILRLKSQGLPVIIVHPTICVGTREKNTTPFGKFLSRYLAGKVRFYLDTGLNLIDVVDVAKAHLLAAKRGKIGNRYILGNQNIYFLEVLQHLSQLTGIPPPKTALPFGFARIGNFLFRNIFQRKSGVSNALIRRLKRPLFFDNSFARDELGYPQSDVWQALQLHIQSLQKN